MTFRRCPGAIAFAQPKIEMVPCPDCGADVEIWSDEATGQCLGCARTVIRTVTQSCVDWCRYAQECLGDEKFKKYGEMKGALRKSALLQAVQAHLKSDDARLARTRKSMAYAEMLLAGHPEADPNVVMAAAALHSLTDGTATAEQALLPAQAIMKDLGYPEGLVNEVGRLLRPPDDPCRRETIHFKLLHDAVLLAGSERKSSVREDDFLTEAGRAAARQRHAQ